MVSKKAKRALGNALFNGLFLALVAWRADGVYDQARLWSIGLFGAGLVAWLTAYAVALTLAPEKGGRDLIERFMHYARLGWAVEKHASRNEVEVRIDDLRQTARELEEGK